MTTEYDAVVVGSGPNGLMAAVTVARAGRRVLVVEAAPTPGGGLRSAELTEPGFVHDVCSTIHPLAATSRAFRDLDLERHGLHWIRPDAPLAHPLDDHTVVMERSVADTAARLGRDGSAWTKLFGRFEHDGTDLVDGVMSSLLLPHHPLRMAAFGRLAVRSATSLAASRFTETDAAAIFAGLAAHSVLPLDRGVTAGVGVFLGGLAHLDGWPLPAGGAQRIADALVAELLANGGEIECDRRVTSLDQLPTSGVVLADVAPRGLLAMAGDRLPRRVRAAYRRFRHGAAVFKLDYALSDPVPWRDPATARAGTVHLGGSFAEVVAAEAAVGRGEHPERPFVLVAQNSLFDPARAPGGQQTLWAYCHVPSASTVDMTDAVERQIERFAPGFRDTVIARRRRGPAFIEADNPNYVGGDIGGGVADLRQMFTRPRVSLRPWTTGVRGLYLCSASTPPGGGVHGMGGWHAARLALSRELR